MKKVFLVNAQEAYFRGKFAVAAQDLGVDYHYLDLTECVFHVKGKESTLYHNNKMIDPQDGYFWIRRKGQDNFFCYLLTEFLSQQGVPFTDPANRSHTLSDMKIAQLLRLAPKGIPFPESYICRPYSFALHQDLIVNNVGFPCVVKRAGERGEAVWLVNNFQELDQKLNEGKAFDVNIIQKYIPNEFDLRVIVFENKIIGAMTRRSTDGFANTAYDAELKITDLTECECQLALESAEKAGVDLAGVDIVRTEQGPLVWEINKTPQLDRFIPATGIDAVSQILSLIKEKYL